jgi:hypothetical protein
VLFTASRIVMRFSVSAVAAPCRMTEHASFPYDFLAGARSIPFLA